MVELRSKLMSRLAVAAGMVAALLAILAFFDYLAAPPDEPEPRVFTRPVPVPPKKEVSQPVVATSNLPEPPVAEVKVEAEKPAPALAESAPPAPAPTAVPENNPPPDVPKLPKEKAIAGRLPAQPNMGERAVPRHAAGRMSVPPVVSTALPVPPAPPVPRVRLPEPPSDVTMPPAINAETRVANARVLQVQPAPPVLPPSAQRLFSGFVLQAGIFSSAQRAEELHAKLALSGVPSSLETRVQVGPFKTRQEAEAAQEKLRELGIGSVLITPKGSKH